MISGHVDAGKSTLMGRLLLDLGVVDQRTIQKYRKEAESIGKSSFALAWVLDQRSEEEQAAAVTVFYASSINHKGLSWQPYIVGATLPSLSDPVIWQKPQEYESPETAAGAQKQRTLYPHPQPHQKQPTAGRDA